MEFVVPYDKTSGPAPRTSHRSAKILMDERLIGGTTMSADPHSRSIDGRAIGDMRIGELEPLAAKKRGDAEQYRNISAAAAMEGGVALSAARPAFAAAKNS